MRKGGGSSVFLKSGCGAIASVSVHLVTEATLNKRHRAGAYNSSQLSDGI